MKKRTFYIAKKRGSIASRTSYHVRTKQHGMSSYLHLVWDYDKPASREPSQVAHREIAVTSMFVNLKVAYFVPTFLNDPPLMETLFETTELKIHEIFTLFRSFLAISSIHHLLT